MRHAPHAAHRLHATHASDTHGSTALPVDAWKFPHAKPGLSWTGLAWRVFEPAAPSLACLPDSSEAVRMCLLLPSVFVFLSSCLTNCMRIFDMFWGLLCCVFAIRDSRPAPQTSAGHRPSPWPAAAYEAQYRNPTRCSEEPPPSGRERQATTGKRPLRPTDSAYLVLLML
jgi:hypothetical protein